MLETFYRLFWIFDTFPAEVAYEGTYDPWLVVTSVLIAILAAFVALTISARIMAATSRRVGWAWACAGAVSMGGGIWSMHFIGMLAFSLPCGVSYDPLGTILSMVPGILASGVALSVIGRQTDPGLKRLLVGAVLMGGGIGAMHYSGMAAMLPDALMRYDPWLVTLSVVVAVALALLSLGIRFYLKAPWLPARAATLIAATIMGCAVAGMHYTAMQASIFYPLALPSPTAAELPSTRMALFIAAVTILIATVTLVAAFAGRQNELVISLKSEVARRRALERLAEGGRTRLQAIFDAVADPIITIDKSGQITQWSSGAQRVLGYRPEEVIGANITILMPEPHRTQHGQYLRAFLETRDAKIIGIGRQLNAIRKDGTEFPVDLTVTEARDGDEIFFTGILRDITDRVRNEAELVRAREEAEAANLAKSRFLATMSHEIRTPMNGVLGMANLLSSTPLSDRQRHLVETLVRSGQALVAIINDILDFSKIEAGQFELFETTFEPREIVAELADLLAERCASEGLEFIYNIAEDVPAKIIGDPIRLRQILVNLAGNAIKFTEHGEILVELSVASRTTDEIVLAVSVKDSGIGIAAEDCSQIFKSFHQLDDSMTRSRGGSGLGLAITKQLVELMGGEIGVESTLGQGSTFRFTARFGQLAGDAGSPDLGRSINGQMRVLLVDGNALSGKIIGGYLATWKIDSTVVLNPDAAESEWRRAAADGQAYDAVIVDVKGLGLAGIEFARAVRTQRFGSHNAEIILLAGLDRLVTDESLDALGAFATLPKPVRPSELFDCLATIAATPNRGYLKPFISNRDSRSLGVKFNARVLVVEDNAVNQEVATGFLESMGCKVITASNGQSAVRLVTREAFDLILMDCEMPVMNGLDATRKIREIEQVNQGLALGAPCRRRATIIALTAHALAEVRQECLDAGMDDFLVKPFDERQMAETLRRWLESEEAHARPPEAAMGAPDPSPTPNDHGESVIDHKVLDGIRTVGGDQGDAFLARVIMKFFESAPGIGAAIREAMQFEDAEAIGRAAHSLKSSAGAIGASRLSQRCQNIESKARSNEMDGAKILIEPLDNDIADAMQALRPMAEKSHELA